MIISIANQKGGQGKTTSAISIGSALTRLEKRVLLIDFDSQRDLSKCLGIMNSNIDNNINNVLLGNIKAKDAVIKLSSGLSLIPGSEKLADTQAKLSDYTILREALRGIVSRYDYIIIDNAPSLTSLTVMAFLTSHEIWLSFQPEWVAITGLQDIQKTIKILRNKFKIDPKIKVIVNMYDARKRLHQEAIDIIKQHFKVFDTYIRTNVALAEAPANNFQDIFTYDPKSHGALDYMALAKEILNGKE